jgi:hypothetical protein
MVRGDRGKQHLKKEVKFGVKDGGRQKPAKQMIRIHLKRVISAAQFG